MNSGLPHTKKALGQHWLTDPQTLQAIVETGQITSADIVLEIGPGAGTLTKLLVEQAREVVAVEFDRALAEALPNQVTSPNLRVVYEDILQFDLTTLEPGYKVVANIPYYLTSNLIRIMSESANPPVLAVLLVQKEVAQRVTAQPGDMSLLSLTAQFFWDVNLGVEVPAHMFTPPPKVDSQLLVLKRREKPLFEVDTKQFFRLVKAGFSNRRKTLLNSLSSSRIFSEQNNMRSDHRASRKDTGTGKEHHKAVTLQALTHAGLNPASRPQELSLEDWYTLYRSLTNS